MTRPTGDVAAILDDPWLNVEQVAAYAGCSKVTVWRHAAAGTLRSAQAGRGRRRKFKRADVDTWVKEAPRLPRRPA